MAYGLKACSCHPLIQNFFSFFSYYRSNITTCWSAHCFARCALFTFISTEYAGIWRLFLKKRCKLTWHVYHRHWLCCICTFFSFAHVFIYHHTMQRTAVKIMWTQGPNILKSCWRPHNFKTKGPNGPWKTFNTRLAYFNSCVRGLLIWYLLEAKALICRGNKTYLDQVPSLWRNKSVQLNTATLGELIKIHLIALSCLKKILGKLDGIYFCDYILCKLNHWKTFNRKPSLVTIFLRDLEILCPQRDSKTSRHTDK